MAPPVAPNAVSGALTNQSSESNAVQLAVPDCRDGCGADCKVELTYCNHRAAMVFAFFTRHAIVARPCWRLVG
ncbi:hypothetical protein [Burkholderia paludis]|uniref:hypothetical protein n=1 Tax=Burkholderia paludis TaxID=1506587 RepID=UPI00126A34C1